MSTGVNGLPPTAGPVAHCDTRRHRKAPRPIQVGNDYPSASIELFGELNLSDVLSRMTVVSD